VVRVGGASSNDRSNPRVIHTTRDDVYALTSPPSPTKPPSSSSPTHSRTLSDNWKGLDYFNRTSLSRHIVTHVSDGSGDYEDSDGEHDGELLNPSSSEVHFLNVEESGSTEAPKQYNNSLFQVNDIIAMASSSRTSTPYMSIPSTLFHIPTLPTGRYLSINILSTWGDPYYVGLMGIELFDGNGRPIAISNTPDSVQIWADPPDINILPEYDNDPRVITNLVDGYNHTADDLHAWLAPFTPGSNHFIYIDMRVPTTISMIRVWNYNKSRIHSYRGARYVEMSLDRTENVVFKGEIKKAGDDGGDNGRDNGESVLFTRDERILSVIDSHSGLKSESNPDDGSDDDDEEENVKRLNTWTTLDSRNLERPSTATKSKVRGGQTQVPSSPTSSQFPDVDAPPSPADCSIVQSDHLKLIVGGHQKDLVQRGMQRGLRRNKSFVQTTSTTATTTAAGGQQETDISGRVKKQEVLMRPSTAPMRRQWKGRKGRHIELIFNSNWGGMGGMGLTGLAVLDAQFQTIPIDPQALRVVTSSQTDAGTTLTLPNLVNGENVTADPRNMWSTEWDGEEVQVYIDLGRECVIGGLKIWNYNGGPEETYFGVKSMIVALDGRLCGGSSGGGGVMVRKAPGYASFDFGQFVALNMGDSTDNGGQQ
jgi:hypothetical protein